jgi:ankyrin repeat protein
MQFNEANPLAASCLGIAARVGNEKAVQKLLKGGRRVDVGDNRGWTPLHEAAAASNIGCLRLLLKKGTTYIAVSYTEIIFQNTLPYKLSVLNTAVRLRFA